MRADDLILISVDDHMVEPPDMFDNHIPAKYKDDVPKLIQRADGTDAWVFEGQEATNVGLNAVAGRPPDEYGAEPTKLSEIRLFIDKKAAQQERCGNEIVEELRPN